MPLMLESNQPEYPPLTSFAESFLHRLATDQYALANLSIVSPAYGEGTWADTQGMLTLWRIVCERSSPEAWFAFIYVSEICNVTHQSRTNHAPHPMQASVSKQVTQVACLLAQPQGMSALTFTHVVSADLHDMLLDCCRQTSKQASSA